MIIPEALSRRALLAGSLAAGGALAAGRGIAPPAAYLESLSAELRKPWPHNRTINIVCHGHSVPAGYSRTPIVRTFDAYPHLLHAALHEAYPYAVVNVIVTAIGGEDAEAGARRFERDAVTKQPDVVLIDYALNDRAIGLERARRAWSAMLDTLDARRIPALLLTPTPDIATDFTDHSQPLAQHASQIRSLAAQYGTGLADSLEAFEHYVASGGRLEDVLAQSNHPNRRGHELVLSRLLPYFWSAQPLTAS